MTEVEWEKKDRNMKSAITRLKNKAKGPITLAAKLELKSQAKVIEGELHNHRLNRFELVSVAAEGFHV